MKILHIIAQLPSKTGSGVYFSNLITEFNKEHENYAIYGNQDSCEYHFDLISKQNSYPVEFFTDEMDFHIVGMSDVMPYNSTKYCDMTEEMIYIWRSSFEKQILKAYDEVKPDIIICHHLWMLTSLTINLLGDKCDKIIGICHGTDIRQALQNPILKNNYVTNLDKLYKIFALSKDQVYEISEVYNIDRDKILVTGGGYNQNLFYIDDEIKNDDNGFLNIVFAGKISDSKGVFELIEAFKLLNYPNDIILNIIGTPQGENIERIHNAIGNSTNIKLFNAKNQESLAALFRYSSIFVLPSYYEGLGLVAIEALASGMLVVSSKLTALMEVLGEEVNKSNIIEYVELPRLKNVDTPYEEDVPNYVKQLSEAIDLQVQRVKNNEEIPTKIYDIIKQNSWENISKEIFKEITS
ncbi:glycosyltransferase family 4 protein [Miniphocaeibacter massiliensis]|uniref:glycosyltransferase family 4 protein n=1 Tax=Miniphocaeibacter massiliensis TaxID=2041841 RepID=UPI000C1C1B1B|nr:glycosyltransferase family 4 protein [Miniphocaeibacter massiliensis]